mmetsp:Transcript_20233/g.43829  ORF Transcript_20233/g.43829 Transcript_20233/m.43829 type:complete len:292 (-) Transcript_20233:324-1199(-)
MLSLARRAQLHAVATSINVTGGTITIIITAIASIVVSFPAENWREVVLEVVAAGANGGHQLASRRCRSAIPAAKAGISIISIAIEGVLLLRLQCLHLRFVLHAFEIGEPAQQERLLVELDALDALGGETGLERARQRAAASLRLSRPNLHAQLHTTVLPVRKLLAGRVFSTAVQFNSSSGAQQQLLDILARREHSAPLLGDALPKDGHHDYLRSGLGALGLLLFRGLLFKAPLAIAHFGASLKLAALERLTRALRLLELSSCGACLQRLTLTLTLLLFACSFCRLIDDLPS